MVQEMRLMSLISSRRFAKWLKVHPKEVMALLAKNGGNLPLVVPSAHQKLVEWIRKGDEKVFSMIVLFLSACYYLIKYRR